MARRRAADLSDLNGLLVIDKPVGLTSHDVVARVRRLTGMQRVGHAGTLDPFATGILVVAVGRATRLLQYVQDTDKGYVTTIVLGVETDSCDVDGAVVQRVPLDPWPTRDAVEACLATFSGLIEQVPPVYSAIKIGGQKLYDLARAGTPVDVPSRRVQINEIELLRYEPPELTIGVSCGKGTYIRALARDIGRALGTAAFCQSLRRTNVGRFCLADCWTLAELEQLDVRERWPEIALASDVAVGGLPAVILGGNDSGSWYHGRSVPFTHDAAPIGTILRAYDTMGGFIGIGEASDEGQIRPTLVFPSGAATPPLVTEFEDVDGIVIREDSAW